MDIKTNGNQLFSVPNDGMGKFFLKLMRRYINRKKFSVTSRGRGASDGHGETRVADAKWLAVYVERKISDIPEQNLTGHWNTEVA